MNPLGRANDKPEDPFDDLTIPLVPMNEGMGLGKTMASMQGHLDEESVVEAHPGTPGGDPMIKDFTPTGDKMQFSKEGSNTYKGNMVRGKVLIKSANKSINNMYGKS